MSRFEPGNATRIGLPSAIGLVVAGTLLAAWSIVVAAVVIVPVLVAAAVARVVRCLFSRKETPLHRPLVIEGEYEVLDSGTGKG